MKTAAVVMGFVCVVLIAVIGFVVSKYQMLSTDFYEKGEDTAAAAPIGAVSEESAKIAKLTKRVAELEKELDLAKSLEPQPPAAGAPGVKEEKNAGKGMMKTLSKMMSDPKMKEAMRGQQRIAIKGMYADFFEELGLSPENEAAVMELLLDRQMMNMEMGVGLMGEGVAEADRKRIAEEITEGGKQINEELKELIGDENFESYELFTDSQQERMQLNAFKESLKAEGEPLSYDAEEQLMNVMYETRKEFKFTTDFGSDANPNPKAWLGFDAAGANRLIAEMGQLQKEVAAKAGAILTPGQLKAFEAAQESQLKMQEMGMKMALEMQE